MSKRLHNQISCLSAYKMQNKLSKRELLSSLKTLKNMLSSFNYDGLHNVIFYNFESFIKYVDAQCSTPTRRTKHSVEELLNILEPYIPFEFDEKALDFLISNVIDNYDAVTFQKILVKRAKVDFINTIKTANTKEKWDRIMKKCQNIHEYKENNSVSSISF